jgi:hypothetical protein
MINNNLPPEYPKEVLRRGQIDTIELDGKVCDVLIVTPEVRDNTTPTIVVPGFTEGIVQDANFAESLSEATGGDVLVLGQYKRESKNLISPEEALSNQADVLLEVIRHNNATHSPINVITSSMGSIVFTIAAEKAHGLGWTCFEKDTSIVFISPAGTKLDEKKRKLFKRFLEESMSSGNDEWDQDALKAGPKLVKEDPKKYLAEGLASLTQSIDYEQLHELGITPRVITNPKDTLLGQEALGESIEILLSSGYLDSWSTPWAHPDNKGVTDTPNSETRHNAHMVNDYSAQRAAEAAARLLTKENE